MNKHRYALLMMLGAYPILVACLYLMPSALMAQPHWVKGLLMVPLMVLGMIYVVSPAIHRHCRAWISAPANGPTPGQH